MAKKSDTTNIGYWAFLIGVLIAIVAGLAAAAGSLGGAADTVIAVLVVLGVVVGFLNLIDKNPTTFLIAVLAISATASAFDPLNQFAIGLYIHAVMSNIVAFVWPAAVIVGLKVIWDLASK
jgi:hypothetical protein